VLERSFDEIAEDLCELAHLAADASDRLGERGRVLLRSRRHLDGDSLDVIEQHLRVLVSAHDEVRRSVRDLIVDARRGRRSPELLEGLTTRRRGFSDRVRTMAGIAAATMIASEWQSPSFRYSIRPNSGVATGHVRPHVDDYRRDRHAEAAAFEDRYLRAYVDRVEGSDLRVLLTNCGMSAFATVLSFLSQTGGLAGPVLVGRSVYHECRDLLATASSLPVTVAEDPVEELPAAISRLRPTALFLDTVGNAPGTLIPDIERVVRAIEEAGGAYLVLDNTGLACTFQPFALRPSGGRVRIIEHQSLTKYAQFGLDRVTAGAIIAERDDADRLDSHREHLGTNIADATVHAIPSPNRAALRRRLARFERNAVVLTTAIQEAATRTRRRVVVAADHPAVSDHPSWPYSRRLPFRGGWLSVGFGAHADHPDVHARFVELVIEEARRRRVQLVAGASFGLDATRVYATTTDTTAAPFVRISPGIEHLWDTERMAESFGAAVARLDEQWGGDAPGHAAGSSRRRHRTSATSL
jgi:cystathionine beta-lyase/cystathionine gamma-synthase